MTRNTFVRLKKKKKKSFSLLSFFPFFFFFFFLYSFLSFFHSSVFTSIFFLPSFFSPSSFLSSFCHSLIGVSVLGEQAIKKVLSPVKQVSNLIFSTSCHASRSSLACNLLTFKTSTIYLRITVTANCFVCHLVCWSYHLSV